MISSQLIVAVLIVVSVLLMVLEIFLIPGVTVCGILSVLLGGGAVWYAFVTLGSTAGIVTAAIWAAMLIAGIVAFVKGKTLDKMSLSTELKETSSQYGIEKVEMGAVGTAVSRLAPMGTVMIDGKEYEAKSQDGFIDQKSEIEVVSILDNHLIVKLK